MRHIRNETELGVAIRERRENAQLTQAQLAERANVSRAFLSELERGKRPRAELSRVLSVLRALETAIVLEEHKTLTTDEALAKLLGIS
jgi:transcriptional regulator with XRE-family HTH domain